MNFPVKPQTTILNNYSVKVTYNLSPNNKLIGYTQPSQKKQPQRFDSFLLGVDTGINTSEATTWNQNFWAWVHKAEWNSVLSDNAFAEIRGGQYGYDWTNGVNGTGLRYEDIGNNLIFGRNRNWARERRRNQVLGSAACSRTPGSASTTSSRRRGLRRNRERHLHRRLRRGHRARDAERRAARHHLLPGAEPVDRNGLWTYGSYINDTWRVSNRLTLNIGVRFDRYRAFLPEQEHAAGQIQSDADCVRRQEQRRRLQPVRAAARPHLRPHGQRQDGRSSSTTASTGSIRAPTSCSTSTRTRTPGGGGIAGPIINSNGRWKPGEEGATSTTAAVVSRSNRSIRTSRTRAPTKSPPSSSAS